MNYKLSYEIKELLDSQSSLDLEESNEEYIIQGVYKYSLNYNNCIFQGERHIKLTVQKNFPNSIPKFYVFDYPEHMEHIYQDGNVCLATTGEMIYFLHENPSLLAFLNKFINSFISKIAISICTLFVLPAKISELDLKYMSRLGLAYSF